MKRNLLLAALFCLGFQLVATAQETENTTSATTVKVNDDGTLYKGIYVAFGAAVTDDMNINKKLKASGMPELNNTTFEATVGFNATFKKALLDMEFNGNYNDQKTTDNRVKNYAVGFRLRPHYIVFTNQKVFFSAGVDITYLHNTFDLYKRGTVIDLDNLDPGAHSGHISLYNDMFYAGPSIAFGAFQKSDFPLRLNIGYEWAFTNGKWKSEFSEVANTVKESGNGRFYAKISIYLN